MKNYLKKHLFIGLAALAFSLSLYSTALAQEINGSIVGTVKDLNGAGVAGATVTITDPSKADIVVRTVITNESGDYSAPNLLVSIYKITVEAPNFKKTVKTDVKLDVGQRRTVDITLEAGRIEETVTVESDPIAVDLQSATSGTIINGDQVREIPVNNRNFVQLVTLAPGVSNDLADQVYVGTTNPEGQANTVNISVNGARSSQNTFTVDGADVTDRGSNLTIQAYPNFDSIGEFRVLRSLYPAESGRSGGGQVNVVTRSGGKQFSGSVFEFIRNEVFNGNQFLINASTAPPFGRNTDNSKAKRPPFRYNNFGWTLGGPVYFLNFGERSPGDGFFRKLDRTFFFFAQEYRRDRRYTAAATVTVPDANLRNGVFPIDVCINLIPSETCTGANVLTAGNPLPANRFNPVALAYLNGIYRKLPLPNQVTSATPYNLVTSLRNVSDFQQEVLKIDHSFSDKWSMYYRFQRDKIPTIDANALFSSGSGLPNVSTTSTNSPGKTHTFQSTYVVNPGLIIQGTYAYGYGAILSENVGLLALTNTTVPITLPFANQRDRIPTITGNGFTGLTSFGPYDNFSYKHNLSGNVTWIKGSHTMKFGGVFSVYRKNENALAGNNEGIFNSFSTALPTGVTASALNQNIQRWANFLVGNAVAFTQGSFDYTADLRQRTIEAYAQDEWRFRPNLTLYYGVRYSFFGAPYDKNGRLSNFVPELWSAASAPQVTGAGNRIAGTGNYCNGIIVNSQNYTTGPSAFNCTPVASPYGKYVIDAPKTDFAPRIGIAWDPFKKGKTSIRTGYGIYHEQTLNGIFLQNIGTNQPYQVNITASNTNLSNPAGNIVASTLVSSLRSVQPNWKTPYMQHWSLDIQQQLTKKTVVTVGYYGSKGTNLIGLTELNDLPAGRALNSLCAIGNAYYTQTPAPTLVRCQLPGYAFRGTATTAAQGNQNPGFVDALILEQLRPYRGYRSIAMVQPRYDSNYHSLQISADHRFTGSSQVKLAYTWAKNLTTSPNDRTTSPQDSYNVALEYQRAVFDRRHILSINYIYELPFFRKQENFVGKILGGWQASGIVTYNTGLPFSVTTSNYDPAGLGFLLANPAGRPNVICDPNANAPHTQAQWFNINCFQQNPVVGDLATSAVPNTIGNAARGIVQGPPTTRFDVTMAKNVRFGERFRFQFRAEVFNIFNHTNFRGFSSLNVTAGVAPGTTFGRIGSTRDPRTMSFGLKVNF